MKKLKMHKMAAFLALAVTCMLPALSSCNNGKPEETEGIPQSQSLVDTEKSEPSPESNNIETMQTEEVTETNEAEEKSIIDVSWNRGYVGSATNQSYPNRINTSGGSYSHTNVFTVEKAGTKITFTDNNTNDNGDAKFASNAAYIISSWKQSNGGWVLDTDGTNIAGSGGSGSIIANPVGDTVVYTYVTSKDNENLRICFRSGQTSSFTPAVFPKIYYEFTGEVGTAEKEEITYSELKAYLEETKQSQNFTQLEGITINALGDSYFAGDSLSPRFVWPNLLALKYNMTFTNYGANGSTMSDYVAGHNPMVSRYSSMANNNPDIVLIEGGKNDYNYNVPIGENGDSTTKTFKGAINTLIDGVRAKYPNALIICITAWNVDKANSLGKTVVDYATAMLQVCEEKNVPCFFAADSAISGVDMNSFAFRSMYCMSASDVSHLNELGHKTVLPNFEKFIAEQYAAFKAAK